MTLLAVCWAFPRRVGTATLVAGTFLGVATFLALGLVVWLTDLHVIRMDNCSSTLHVDQALFVPLVSLVVPALLDDLIP